MERRPNPLRRAEEGHGELLRQESPFNCRRGTVGGRKEQSCAAPAEDFRQTQQMAPPCAWPKSSHAGAYPGDPIGAQPRRNLPGRTHWEVGRGERRSDETLPGRQRPQPGRKTRRPEPSETGPRFADRRLGSAAATFASALGSVLRNVTAAAPVATLAFSAGLN